jgi:hypothetical protein
MVGEPGRPWLVLKLRKEIPESISLEHEFELFTRTQRVSSDRILRQVQALKNVAYLTLIVVIVIGFVIVVRAVVSGANRSRLFRPKTSPSRLEQPLGNKSTNRGISAKPTPRSVVIQ